MLFQDHLTGFYHEVPDAQLQAYGQELFDGLGNSLGFFFLPKILGALFGRKPPPPPAPTVAVQPPPAPAYPPAPYPMPGPYPMPYAPPPPYGMPFMQPPFYPFPPARRRGRRRR